MTKKLAFASVMTALTALFLCGSILLPTGRLAFLMMTSFCVLVTTAECGTKYGFLSFGATALIGFLFMPFKLQLVLFAAILGYYPIVKSYIERMENIKLEWIVKVLFFSAVLVIAYFLVRYALMPKIELGVMADYVFSHLPVIVVAAEILFIIYDVLLSMLASYYINVIQKRIKIN